MLVEVGLPDLGEDTDAIVKVSTWLIEIGAHVHEGDELIELTTDKAAFTLPAPQGGSVLEQCVCEGDEISVGEIICILEV